MKAELVTEVIDKNTEIKIIGYVDGFQDNSPIVKLNSPSIVTVEKFTLKAELPSVLITEGRVEQCIEATVHFDQTALKEKPKYCSPKILSRIMLRKGYTLLSAPLLARGKYFVMAENARGHCKLITINARSGVILKRRYVMRKMASKPLCLFDYIA